MFGGGGGGFTKIRVYRGYIGARLRAYTKGLGFRALGFRENSPPYVDIGAI